MLITQPSQLNSNISEPQKITMKTTTWKSKAESLLARYEKAFEESFLHSLKILKQQPCKDIYVYNIYFLEQHPDCMFSFNTEKDFRDFYENDKEQINAEFAMGLGSERYNPAVYEHAEYCYLNDQGVSICRELEELCDEIYELTDIYDDSPKNIKKDSPEYNYLVNLRQQIWDDVLNIARRTLTKHYLKFNESNITERFVAFVTTSESGKERNNAEVMSILGSEPTYALFPDIKSDELEKEKYEALTNKEKIEFLENLVTTAIFHNQDVNCTFNEEKVFGAITKIADLRPESDPVLIKWLTEHAPRMAQYEEGTEEWEVYGPFNDSSKIIQFIGFVVLENPEPNPELLNCIQKQLLNCHDKLKQAPGIVPIGISELARLLNYIDEEKFPFPETDENCRVINIDDYK